MSYVIVHHMVEDFARWKPFFDGDADARRAHGSQGCQLMRGADNPNEVVIVFKWDSLENARRFTQMPALREIMQQAGVVTMPDFYFLEEVEQGAA